MQKTLKKLTIFSRLSRGETHSNVENKQTVISQKHLWYERTCSANDNNFSKVDLMVKMHRYKINFAL